MIIIYYCEMYCKWITFLSAEMCTTVKVNATKRKNKGWGKSRIYHLFCYVLPFVICSYHQTESSDTGIYFGGSSQTVKGA